MRFVINEETFSCTGKTLISAGYTAVMTWQAISAQESIPDCVTGDVCAVNEVRSRSCVYN